MISIGFNLEVDEGALAPSPSEFADALAEALPKEWWADHRCDSWGVTGLFPTVEMSASEALSLRQALGAKDKKIRTLEAVLAQEQKLTVHLERQLTLRQKQIADLEGVIADRDATQDDFAKRVRELIDRRDRLQSRLNDSLIEWGIAKAHVKNLVDKNDNQREIIEQQQANLTKQHEAIKALKVKTLDASAEAQEHTIMVERIVDALEAAGYDVAGRA